MIPRVSRLAENFACLDIGYPEHVGFWTLHDRFGMGGEVLPQWAQVAKRFMPR